MPIATTPDLPHEAGGHSHHSRVGADLGADLGVDLSADLGADLGVELGVELGVDGDP